MTGDGNTESKYIKLLNSLAENNRITEDQLSHFLKRGIQVYINWQFFGDHLKESNPPLYEDLIKLEKLWIKKNNNNNRRLSSRSLRYVVIARSDATFKKLDIVEEYGRHNIAVLDPKNEISVIFLTNQSGYDYASKDIRETDFIDYIVTGKQFDIQEAMLDLRRKYDIDVMLNDGGRQMSNSLRDAGLLAEERVTLEPHPGTKIIPENLDPTSILGDVGLGLDGSEIEGTIMIHSIRIGDERANVYLYPLNETKIF